GADAAAVRGGGVDLPRGAAPARGADPTGFDVAVSTPPPSLQSLRCFVEAARLLNFRAAARAVALTPAALGQRIAQLEGQIGRAAVPRHTPRGAPRGDGTRAH